jgi:adenylate cyclase
MDERLPRKLAAILYADVAGYSRLTGDDEDTTHRALSEYLDLISETINTYHGEVMHYAGDAVLAKFEAVIDAVSSATEIQKQLLTRNANLPEEQKVQFRIGVNSGDVIEDRGDIFGDGVNIAARLESLAEPGGICVSDAVRIAIGNKLGLIYEDMGKQKVKNITEAVHAYNIDLREDVREVDPLNLPPLELPDNPSIAVLPFTNMSNDPEQEFFSDGITEDIITALSKISSMLVIARNSTFIYKGKAVDVKQVGRDQGVRYVLEGGVRKAGNRVRITAQLIDTTTGQHRWAERYDRDLGDIFAVQDEITQKIVSELDVQLGVGEQARLWSSGTGNLEAWECVRLGSDLLNSVKGDQIPEAMRLVKRAIDLDPEYAAAWSWLALSHFHIAENYDSTYTGEERKQALQSTHDCAHQALEFDPSSADAYVALGLYHLSSSEHEAAMANINKSVRLAPNHVNNVAISAGVLVKCGQPEKAIERIRKAMRLSPISPPWYLSILGQAYRLADMIDAAIETYNEFVNIESDNLEGQIALAEIFGETNQPDRAAVSAKEVLRLNPDFSVKNYVAGLAYSDPAENLRFADGLRKAGLPE